MPDLLKLVRDAAKARQRAFSEAIWKGPQGESVTMAAVHDVMCDYLDRGFDAKVPCVLIAPRGLGKTETLLSYITRLLARYPYLRGQIVSDNDEHGQDRLGTVRRVIEADPDFRRIFPDVGIDYSKLGRRTLAKFRLTSARHTKDASLEAAGILSSGAGGRKDFIAFDDVCTERNTILSPADRARVKRTFFGTWLPTIEPGSGWWFLIATLYHADDLTHALLVDAGLPIASLRIGLAADFTCYDVEQRWPGEECKRYTLPLWEPKWSKATYERRRDEMAAAGEATQFLAAYRNLIIDPATAAFKLTDFQRSFPIHTDLKRYRYRVLYADPATSEKRTRDSDYYAGVVLGWDPDLGAGGAAVVLHAWYAKLNLRDRVDRYLQAVEHFVPHRAGIEGIHEVSFGQRIEEVAHERGVGLRLVRVTHNRVDKIARISSIAPLITSGKILVDIQRFPWFWEEAQTFPSSAHDDGLDALEGAWSLLRGMLRRSTQVPLTFDTERQFWTTDEGGRGYTFNTGVPARRTIEERLFGL